MEAPSDTEAIDWSRVCSDAFVPLRVDVDDDFHGAIRQVQFGGVTVSHIVSSPVVVDRPASLIVGDPRDDVILCTHRSGNGWLEQAGRTARLTANTAALCQTDRPYRLRFDSPFSELVLQVPRRRLRIRAMAIRESTGRLIEGRTSGLTVLTHLMAGIVREGCPDVVGDQLAETALDLVSAILNSHTVGDVLPRLHGEALLRAARVYMRRNHTDPELDTAAVAAAHSVSRRYLEQLFARAGESPAAYLRDLRLTEALVLLRETSARVTDIAHMVGFNDVNTFIRAFRRLHGVTPRDWRRGNHALTTTGRFRSGRESWGPSVRGLDGRSEGRVIQPPAV